MDATNRRCTYLIHELHTPSQEHSTASLDLISLEDARPLVFAMFALQRNGFSDLTIHDRHLWAVRRLVPYVAHHLQCFFLAIVVVEPSWAFWHAEDHVDDDECEDLERGVVSVYHIEGDGDLMNLRPDTQSAPAKRRGLQHISSRSRRSICWRGTSQ